MPLVGRKSVSPDRWGEKKYILCELACGVLTREYPCTGVNLWVNITVGAQCDSAVFEWQGGEQGKI